MGVSHTGTSRLAQASGQRRGIISGGRKGGIMEWLDEPERGQVIEGINQAYFKGENAPAAADIYQRYSHRWSALFRMIAIAEEMGTVKRPVKVMTDNL